MTDVELHNSAESCYTAIRGEVYDLTSWISVHPGGEKVILDLCGKDGTTAFEGKHGGMQKQEQTLETFKIGELVL